MVLEVNKFVTLKGTPWDHCPSRWSLYPGPYSPASCTADCQYDSDCPPADQPTFLPTKKAPSFRLLYGMDRQLINLGPHSSTSSSRNSPRATGWRKCCQTACGGRACVDISVSSRRSYFDDFFYRPRSSTQSFGRRHAFYPSDNRPSSSSSSSNYRNMNNKPGVFRPSNYPTPWAMSTYRRQQQEQRPHVWRYVDPSMVAGAGGGYGQKMMGSIPQQNRTYQRPKQQEVTNKVCGHYVCGRGEVCIMVTVASCAPMNTGPWYLCPQEQQCFKPGMGSK